ncbi:MAG TPA: hypothetical protein VGC98_03585 [Thermoleophilaceae bacterium]
MRRAALAIATAALIAGCGGSGKTETSTTSTRASTAPKRTYRPPKYVPDARHKHRPPGYIYNDEIGENVLTAPYSRIIQLFGPPASRHGNCILYRIVGRPKDMWHFCFKGQKMIGASG